ncbi:hypothetical protein PVAND_003069 [Polypedilum vanderplanki]|uniref:Uncharacterized protein n=1 Tax=Polypedilum vanderplanki TaxID=319348 RepID=A0A9J6BSX0_POLVA|nr:hypothetical protein PVAND_003069 [Polypedilum vanderplanki]
MNESYDFEDEMELEEMEVERLESVETDFSHSLLNLNWSNYYNINEKEQVTEILEDMQFGIFSQRFADECIDIDSFLKLTPFHIAKILHDVPTANKIALGVTQVSAISKQICSLYSRETIEEYFGYVNGKYSGAFYTAHNNMLKKLHSENLIPSRKRKRESKIVDQILPETLFTSDELASNEFVKRSTANIDTKILIDHWRKSSKLRLEAFKNEKSSTVLSQYRALQRPDAIILIDIDFNTLHPLHSDFKSKWMEQENKLITILQTELKGKQKQKLNSLEVLTSQSKDSNYHSFFTSRSLHTNSSIDSTL